MFLQKGMAKANKADPAPAPATATTTAPAPPVASTTAAPAPPVVTTTAAPADNARYASTTDSTAAPPKPTSSSISWTVLSSSNCFSGMSKGSSFPPPTFNTSSILVPPIISNSKPKPCCCSSSKPKSSPGWSKSSSCPILPPPKPKGSCPPPEPNNPYDVISGKNPGPVDSDGSKACVQDNLSTNALGAIGPLNFALTRAPYKIESCDQVIIVEGETFQDPRDYSVKVKAFFTLSIYMVNMLGASDPNTLKRHMLFNEIDVLPDEVLGAPNCLDFMDSKTLNRIVMCFKTKTQFHQIKSSYRRLMECRAGNNLSAITEDKLSVMLRAACFGKDLVIDQKDAIMSLLTPIKTEAELAKKKENDDAVGKNNKLILNEWTQKYGVNPAYGVKVPGQLRR